MSASSLRTLYQNVSEAWTDKVIYQIAPSEKIKHTFSSFDRVPPTGPTLRNFVPFVETILFDL